ncbi:ATP-NAD kinase-like domain-containing protein [Chaetomidium leptoderma]|uniref:ATP-NAD kinase-like domain-containing protein n=1 Tax=Chaetomidium leptoderma TaxID=669021 RepID=A0AAN6VS83_9PEZI|nr:ATP-NAD kinase-like domain-containing protein [Chaetomidium leptoderma]
MSGSVHPGLGSWHPATLPLTLRQERYDPAEGVNKPSSGNPDCSQTQTANPPNAALALTLSPPDNGEPSSDAAPAPATAPATTTTTVTTTATTTTATTPTAAAAPPTPTIRNDAFVVAEPQPTLPAVGASVALDSDLLPHHSSHSVPAAPAAPPRGHRKNALSVESVPRQTIMKALASVARNNKPQALSLTGMLSAHSAAPNGADNRPASSSSQQLCDALNGLAQAQSSRPSANANATPTAAYPSLQSPCFYHNRFDDAVDIDRVLEEIKNDEWMSHSRLVQTATGVREVSKQLQRRPIKRAVKNVMIVTKARDNQLVVLTRELTQWLLRTPRYGSDLGVNVYVDAKLRHSKRFDARGITDENPRFQEMLKYWTPDLCWTQPEKFDLVLTLGGDGTVLFTSWLFQRIVPPVLSFSLGSLGFMTSFEFERYKFHLSRVMGEDGMRVNLRMRFTCTVYRDGPAGHEVEEGEQFEVLNELVIDRGPSPYVSNLELYGDNELLTVVQADGCIFSTPTGSTAYSLSAGGSLVHPDIPAILLTPICPHTLSFRPMVLSDTMLLRVSVPRNSRATAYCAFDGKGRIELKQGDHVTITASQYPFPTVVRTDTEWFDSVSRTLRWNVRAATQKGFDLGGGGADGNALSEGGSEEDDRWDIDTDSACYASEESSTAASPLRRQMSMLGL